MEKNALGKAPLRQKLRAASGLPLTPPSVEHEFGTTTLTIVILARRKRTVVDRMRISVVGQGTAVRSFLSVKSVQ
jgi:hypothetical protein